MFIELDNGTNTYIINTATILYFSISNAVGDSQGTLVLSDGQKITIKGKRAIDVVKDVLTMVSYAAAK